MTEDDLKSIERTANVLSSFGVWQAGEMMRTLITEVRRLHSGAPETSTLIASVTPEDKTALIADLQRMHFSELVQIYDRANRVVGIGCKLNPMHPSPEDMEYAAAHGIVTINEYRRFRNYPPLASGGDVPITPEAHAALMDDAPVPHVVEGE